MIPVWAVTLAKLIYESKFWRELRGKQYITVEADMVELDADGNPIKRVSSTTKIEQVGGPSGPSTE